MSEAPESAAPATGRRHLTLLFSDLSQSTALGAAMEAEHYAELLQQLHAAYTRLVTAHGGTVVRIQGDGLLAVFGLVQADESDGRRAVLAALDLHDAVRRLRPQAGLPAAWAPAWAADSLRLHTGVHAGLVLVAAGDLVRGRVELHGHAPNIAARLSQEAGPDEILVSQTTLGPDRELFTIEAWRALQLRGDDEALTVGRVVADAGLGRRFEAQRRRGLSPFVGRTAERLRLDVWLTRLQQGDALATVPLLQLSGGVGLGKTRLAEEFVQQAARAGCGVHRGWCENHLIAEPLQPWLQMLRALFGLPPGVDPADGRRVAAERIAALGAEVQAHADDLLRLLSLDEAAPGPRRPPPAAGPALAALFGALAAQAPQLLFIDDWQWCDDASHQALEALRARPGPRLMLLVAHRVAAAGEAAGAATAGGLSGADERIDLPALDEADADRTIAHLLPGHEPWLRSRLQAQAGGNPLFIEALCHSALDPALSQRARRRPGAAWLNVLIESRVARLPPAPLQLLRAAAVMGPVIPGWLFERVTGTALQDGSVEHLAREGLLHRSPDGGLLRFPHGVMREAIYDAVGMHERKALHQLAAGVLHEHALATGSDESVEALAHHYAAAGLVAAASQFAERAGDKALAASALDRAKAQYRAALAALDQLEPAAEGAQHWVAIAQKLAMACVFDAYEEELPLFRRAVALAEGLDDPGAVTRCRYWLAYVSYSLGDASTARQEAERALQAAAHLGDDRLTVQLRATLGQALCAAARYDEATPLLDGAIEVKRRHRTGTGLAVGLAYTLACKAYLLGDRGDFAAAHEMFDEALGPVRGRRHQVEASILGWQAAVLLWQGRWAEAADIAAQAVRVGEHVRSLFTYAMGQCAGAYAGWMLNRDAQALVTVGAATDWLHARGVRLFGSFNEGWLCDMHAAGGDAARAQLHALQALRCARRHDHIGVALACRAMARQALVAPPGQRPDAEALRHAAAWLKRAERSAAARQSAHEAAGNTLLRAEWHLAQAETATAMRELDLARSAFGRLQMPWHLMQAQMQMQMQMQVQMQMQMQMPMQVHVQAQTQTQTQA